MMARIVGLAGALWIGLTITSGQGQTGLRFEVASVKPSGSFAEMLANRGSTRNGETSPGRVDLTQWPLNSLIAMAYKVRTDQIEGPDWMAATRFDIIATIPPGATQQDVPEMLQALLVERFKLVLHHESRQRVVYELTVEPGGPHLKDAPPGPEPEDPFPQGVADRVMYTRSIGPHAWAISVSPSTGLYRLDAPRISIPELCTVLMSQNFVEIPVLDRTNLTGRYDLVLDLPTPSGRGGRDGSGRGGRGRGSVAAAGDPADPLQTASDPSGVSLVRTIRKLGLRLERHNGRVDHLVLEHIEKVPTGN